MKEIEAPLSTIKQRKGRLGRTSFQGEYYLCSENRDNREEYHQSELEKIDLTNIYYSLLRIQKDCKAVEIILNRIPKKDKLTFSKKI